MNYGKVEEPSSSRRQYPSTARYAATSAILTAISSKSDRAPTSRTGRLARRDSIPEHRSSWRRRQTLPLDRSARQDDGDQKSTQTKAYKDALRKHQILALCAQQTWNAQSTGPKAYERNYNARCPRRRITAPGGN